ncbi:MAG: hypothetical protein DRP64_17505 [Verrucomicrobia bacterium]|nr:MAG: hypothetical protein DRP64_17505 [Verrucomicrobiota bacterium]
MKIILTALVFCFGPATFADDLAQLYEKAYFLETAKGQSREALVIYRQIAATEPTDENRSVIAKALDRLQEEYAFPYAVPFSAGYTALTNGDAIHIEAVQGSEKEFKVGGTYRVTGTYTLSSAPRAVLSFYLTTTGFNSKAPTRSPQRMEINKGSGRFELMQTFATNGWPHLSLYPSLGGSGLGGIYFGSGKWLRKKPVNSPPDLRETIIAFDMTGGREDVLREFGQPLRYGYAGETFSPDTLPRQYIMFYPADFSILMADGKIREFRMEGDSDVRAGGLSIGMTSSMVFAALDANPLRRPKYKCHYKPGYFYTRCPNKPAGWGYYATKAVRVFFMNDNVTAYYIMDNRPDRMLLHARFRDHGDRAFTDSATGLTWYRPSGNKALNWGEAKAFCDNLDAAGYTDWRLPTINELWSLYSGRNWPSQSRVPDFRLWGGIFWSATPYAGDSIKAWRLDVYQGNNEGEDKENLLRILPVRGSSHADTARPVIKTSPNSADPGVPWPEPRFTAVGDETVVDHMTGLMWLKNPDRFEEADYHDREAVCKKLDAGGFTDWRIPTMDEFATLIDRGRKDPALPKDHPFSLHWANTNKLGFLPTYWCEKDPSVAGVLWPHDGHTFGNRNKMTAAYLWPVRNAGVENNTSGKKDEREVSQ